MTDGTDDRLKRIEDKLDGLTEAVVRLARIEERVATILQRMDEADRARASHQSRIADLERMIDRRAGMLVALERLFWIAATAGLTVWASSLAA
ncbi:Flp pilus assembly protein TadB [Roseovarius sp. MBR-154]|jgi:Flp pilus assembly protein TadB